jgi:hypothetical protein
MKRWKGRVPVGRTLRVTSYSIQKTTKTNLKASKTHEYSTPHSKWEVKGCTLVFPHHSCEYKSRHIHYQLQSTNSLKAPHESALHCYQLETPCGLITHRSIMWKMMDQQSHSESLTQNRIVIFIRSCLGKCPEYKICILSFSGDHRK